MSLNRWLAGLDLRQFLIDTIIVVSVAALLLSSQKVAWFHLVFLLLVISAFRLNLVPLLVRAVPAGIAVVAALLIAWSNDEVPTDELYELPILSAMIVVVYLTSSRRKRLTREIDQQRETIEALHDAARRELQDQLLLSQRLQVTNRLNSAVVHDVNNILAGLRIAAETLTERAHDTTYVETTGAEIEQFTEQAGHIIKELLGSSRMTNTLAPQPGANVRAAITELEPLLRRLCGKRIELVIDAGDPDSFVALPRLRLEQVLTNLVTNSVDAMPDTGGEVAVIATATEEEVRIDVRDTGHGIDSAVVDQVFDPYFSTKDDREGSGLGLFAARELVTDEGGRLEVASHSGEGTTFTITLPLVAENPTPPQRRSGRRHALRLLLVDDDDQFRHHLADALRSAGHQVTAAVDGQDALEKFSAGPKSFDVVISDVAMPRLTGVHLAEAVSDLSPDTPILLMTGHGQIRFDHRVARHATPVRQKPFTTADLLTDLQLIAESLET